MAEGKTPGSDSPTGADSRRVAACVAACEGIPTEALENGIILKLIAACFHVKEPRIQEVLDSLGAIRARPARSGPPERQGR